MRALRSFTSTKQLLRRLISTLKRLTQSYEKPDLPDKKCLGGRRGYGLATAQDRGQEPSCIFLAEENVFLQASLRSFLSYVTVSVLLLTLFSLPTVALASSGTKHIDTSNVFSRTPKPLALEESKEVNSGKAKERSEVKSEQEETVKVNAKAAEMTEKEKAEGEEKEEEPSWKIPGWQSIFTALAVAFYALMLTVLPKIMAKEVEHH